jgi:hypothetical protein
LHGLAISFHFRMYSYLLIHLAIRLTLPSSKVKPVKRYHATVDSSPISELQSAYQLRIHVPFKLTPQIARKSLQG